MKVIRLFLIVFCCSLAACDQHEQTASTAEVTTLEVWAHAGQASERQVIEQQISTWNKLHDDVQVELTFIPERSYNAQVQAAAIAGDLPDLLEFDVPYLYNYAWQGQLQPLDDLLPEQLQADLLPSILKQGRYRGQLYGVGTFDSGLALYARRGQLQTIEARIPTHPDQAWTVDEFAQILGQLSVSDEDGSVLDLKLNYPDEWFAYAFSPMLQSAGADLIARDDYQHSDGVINSVTAINAMEHLQGWLMCGWVDANVDDAAFVSGRVAISLAGHWEYQRYAEAFGDDLVLLPLPDFGEGTRTGQGSWVWGITRKSQQAKQAAALIEFMMQPEQILAMTQANGAVPATISAIDRSPLYQKGGPLHLFVQQLRGGYSVPRPATPAYPVISASFRQAFADIRNGSSVQQALDRAARTIDEDISDNRGYPPLDL
jgi:multiple sugar transport system substrate-binding protein